MAEEMTIEDVRSLIMYRDQLIYALKEGKLGLLMYAFQEIDYELEQKLKKEIEDIDQYINSLCKNKTHVP